MSQDTGSPQRRAKGLERSRLSLLFWSGLSLSHCYVCSPWIPYIIQNWWLWMRVSTNAHRIEALFSEKQQQNLVQCIEVALWGKMGSWLLYAFRRCLMYVCVLPADVLCEQICFCLCPWRCVYWFDFHTHFRNWPPCSWGVFLLDWSSRWAWPCWTVIPTNAPTTLQLSRVRVLWASRHAWLFTLNSGIHICATSTNH